MIDTPHPNVSPEEIAKFESFAANWWDPQGEMKPLHQLNPLRLNYIQNQVQLSQQKIVDVGCGGGILSESLAKNGAEVTGIDLSAAALQIAREHAQRQQLPIHYQNIAVEEMAERHPAQFDTVTCMELLEHVPDPASVVKSCATLVKPGGTVFFSTLNRNLKSFFLAIVAAEYMLRLLPRGTHHYGQFIKPSELAKWARAAKLHLKNLQGIEYSPWNGTFRLSDNVDVNYLICFTKLGQHEQT